MNLIEPLLARKFLKISYEEFRKMKYRPSQSNESRLDWQSFKFQYDRLIQNYERLAEGAISALRVLLAESGISILEISHRIKTPESAFEKIRRKSYSDPFNQIEDWCGIRVICYYPSDLEKISQLIRTEFSVKNEEDTQTRLAPQEFGYRSTHLIVTIQKSWLKVPGYRGLNNLRAEIQVRTILMHAWAEIQHKLAYKSPDQIPDAFRRKLFRLSAKFEETDEQFEDLREGLGAYRESIRMRAQGALETLNTQELNLDTLAALLDMAYPDREASEQRTASLLTEISAAGLKMEDLVDAIGAQRPFIDQIEASGIQRSKWAQVGAMRNALDIYNDAFYSKRKHYIEAAPDWGAKVRAGRSLLGKKN